MLPFPWLPWLRPMTGPPGPNGGLKAQLVLRPEDDVEVPVVEDMDRMDRGIWIWWKVPKSKVFSKEGS